MSSPPLSDDEIENFIAEQKARLQRERFRDTALQQPNLTSQQPSQMASTAPAPAPEVAVRRARDANRNFFDKIVRADVEEASPSDKAEGLPIADRRSARERMKAEMNREYNEFLRQQEEQARARRKRQPTAASSRPPPAPTRRVADQSNARPLNAGTFLTEAPDSQLQDASNEARRDAQLEDLAEKVRQLRAAAGNGADPSLDLRSQLATRPNVQTVQSDASSNALSNQPSRTVQSMSVANASSNAADLEGEDYFASLPIRERTSAKVRANDQRNREYNEYLRLKEEVEKQRLLARRTGGDDSTGLLLPSQAAQDLRMLPPPAGMPMPVPMQMQMPMPMQSGQPVVVVQGDSRPYATLRQSRSLSNLAAMGDPFGSDSRFLELEAELDRTKRRLLGGAAGPSGSFGYNPSGFSGNLFDGAISNGGSFTEPSYPLEKMTRAVPHMAGSAAVVLDSAGPLTGDPVQDDRRRRNTEYARDLLAQIEMNREGRRRARSADLQVDITGFPDIPHATRFPQALNSGPLPLGPSLRGPGPVPGPLPLGRPAPVGPYPAVAAPLPLATSPLASPDLYDYFAMHHPLELGVGGGSALAAPLATLPPPGPFAGPRVMDRSYEAIQRIRPDELNSGLSFASDEERKHLKRAKEQAYQAELNRQVEDSLRRKERDIVEQARYNAQKDAESATYNPFGRGGGGAPLRDQFGNVVTDLRRVRNPAAGGGPPPPPPPPPGPVDPGLFGPPGPMFGFGSPPMPMPGSPPMASSRGLQMNAFGEMTQARGGNGIFGTPLTDEQKASAERYKDELRMQIEEKRAKAEAEKMRQAEEDARENRRLMEQQERIKREMEAEEQQRKRKEEVELRRKEELERQMAANNEANAPKRRRERVPTRASRNGGQSTFRLNDDPRPASPPVPAVRNRIRQTGLPSHREEPSYLQPPARETERNSATERDRQAERERIAREREQLERERAELEAERQRESTFKPKVNVRIYRDLFDDVSSRASSALGVIEDLSKLRSTLQNEKNRIETELEKEALRVQVNDPRLQPRAVVRHLTPPPPPAPMVVAAPHKTDIIEHVTHRQPVVVHHHKRNAPPKPIEDPELDAALAALSKKPTKPETIDRFRTLRNRERNFKERYPETPQSDVSLEEQQEALIEEQKRRINKLKSKTNGSDAMLMLHSDAAFLDVDSARPRRAARHARDEEAPRAARERNRGGVDPDRIANKNQRRLRNLKEATARGDVYTVDDTDDILDKYVYNYDASKGRGGASRRDVRTPDDDSWLYS